MSSSVAGDVAPLRHSRVDLRRIVLLVTAYAVIRLFGLAMLNSSVTGAWPDASFGAPDPPTTFDKLAVWDGGWYIRIAEQGYPDHLSLVSPRDDATAALVFPPLYPMSMRMLHLVGIPAATAGLLISALAGIAAVIGVYAVARDVISPRASMLTALMWAGGPMTIVLAMVYSEALFVALAAWAIWCARRGWWLWAATLALLAGLTRSTGLAVGAAVAVAAILAWRDSRGAQRSAQPHTSARWRVAAGAAIAVAGVPLWWLYVAIASGRADGWFAAQDFYWGSRFDFAASSARSFIELLGFAAYPDPLARVVYSAAVFAMLGMVLLAVGLIAHAWRLRQFNATQWWPLVAYGVVLVVLAVGSGGYLQSKIRFVVPMFVLLLLPARRLAAASLATRIAAITVLVLAGSWMSTFMLSVWPYAI